MDTVYRPELKKPDPNSIKTTTMLSFVVFAIILIFIVWSLTSFFVDTYYSSMRAQEVRRVAKTLKASYQEDPFHFEKSAIQTASANGYYIRMDGLGEQLVFDGTNSFKDAGSFGQDIKTIKTKMHGSHKDEITATIKDKAKDTRTRLIYATKVDGYGVSCDLFIIAPLYPDQGTIQIYRNILVYVSFIVLFVAIVLAFYLSSRITKPIQSITNSAKELSHGNYNVKFNGSEFTETRELAKTLNQASYEMEKTDFYQREIIANVSHDLKTPLTMIRGYAEKIIDISGDNPEKRNRDLNIIISETERLNKLVSDMMTVSNLQSNNITLNKEVFNIVGAAKEVFDSFQVLNSQEGFQISFHPCKATFVQGDKTKIMQVMSNFVSNAVKYSGDNKYVDIQLKRSGKKIIFHCVDHGVGIPQDELQHVWDKYYRTSANHERDIEGTGLGLSIVKGILTLHNASYGVNSEEGKGSDFWFELDVVKKPTEKYIEITTDEESVNGKEK